MAGRRGATAQTNQTRQMADETDDAREPVLPRQGNEIEGFEGEMREEQSDRILAMANVPELEAEGADLPLLSWNNSAEVKGGDLTSIGFARLAPGFQFRGYIVGTEKVPSSYDSAAGPRLQDVYLVKGTARVPLQGGIAGTLGEISGRMKLPTYASLVEAIDQNFKDEKRLGKKIAIEIAYLGQSPDRKGPLGEKVRSGRHQFTVKRITFAAVN